MTANPIDDVKADLKKAELELRKIADEVKKLHDDLCVDASLLADTMQYGSWDYRLAQTKALLEWCRFRQDQQNGSTPSKLDSRRSIAKITDSVNQ